MSTRCWIAIGASVLVVLLGPATALGAYGRAVTPKGGVKTPFGVRAIGAPARTGKAKVFLLRSLRVAGTTGGAIRVDCPEDCRRRTVAVPVLRHRRGATTIRNLDIELLRGAPLRVRWFASHGTSRYMHIEVAKRWLAITAAGCLGRKGKPAACPAPHATPTPVTPPATPVVDVPLVGAPPLGALSYVRRIGAGLMELGGWAKDPDVPDGTVTIRGLADGQLLGTAKADVSRADVGPHGFTATMLVDELAHSICVEAVNLAGGSDARIGSCRPVPAYGDIDADGVIGCKDLAIQKTYYGQSGVGYAGGDMNTDGVVNVSDLSILLSRFNSGEPSCP